MRLGIIGLGIMGERLLRVALEQPLEHRRERTGRDVRLVLPGDDGGHGEQRVASAVGEGAMSVYLVHRYLASV